MDNQRGEWCCETFDADSGGHKNTVIQANEASDKVPENEGGEKTEASRTSGSALIAVSLLVLERDLTRRAGSCRTNKHLGEPVDGLPGAAFAGRRLYLLHLNYPPQLLHIYVIPDGAF